MRGTPGSHAKGVFEVGGGSYSFAQNTFNLSVQKEFTSICLREGEEKSGKDQ